MKTLDQDCFYVDSFNLITPSFSNSRWLPGSPLSDKFDFHIILGMKLPDKGNYTDIVGLGKQSMIVLISEPGFIPDCGGPHMSAQGVGLHSSQSVILSDHWRSPPMIAVRWGG